MPFLLAEILNFQGSTHRIGVGSFSKLFFENEIKDKNNQKKYMDKKKHKNIIQK